MIDESEPVLDVEPISISDVSVKTEKNDESGIGYVTKPVYVKREYNAIDQKPKLVKPISSVPSSVYGSVLSKKGQKVVEDRKVSLLGLEDGDFEEEVDWLLVGRNAITGLSTAKGRKLEDNEIVHFAFPIGDLRSKSGYWASSRAVSIKENAQT
ncbi:hypothetical protein L1987_73248 [Smallanthus sonchifolius]|uniref:Uncharacterized protein n=1 Tax=Smallanthus sonchifolius TaxID=185202 RepID=A0ACB8ZZK2_9ASTR|nr:hypothetical protein L1987_73248 [Smallanthus sonchifolius]